jgi:hypothetical protein
LHGFAVCTVIFGRFSRFDFSVVESGADNT